MADRLQGRCLCGGVTITATPKELHVEACHCPMCRSWGGGAFLSLACGADTEIQGEDLVVRYRSSDWADRGFCGRCGSHLFYCYLPEGSYAVAAGLFPDERLEPVSEEIFIDEKPAYYSFAGPTRKVTAAEVMARFGFEADDAGEAAEGQRRD